MQDRQIARLLHQLRSREPPEAWAEFLQSYSPLILQVVRFFERDADRTAACFLFVCQQLSQKRFRRLRRFQPKGPATFSTWLRAVVHNLCLDWHRKEFGRHRVFQSISRLSAFEREVFRCRHQQGLSLEETFSVLRTRFADLAREKVEEADRLVRHVLTPRQLWLLLTLRPKFESLDRASAAREGIQPRQIANSRPDPETQAALGEQRGKLLSALEKLPKAEKILIRLRYEQGLTLEEVARVTGLVDPQRVDRRIRESIERLRKDMK